MQLVGIIYANWDARDVVWFFIPGPRNASQVRSKEVFSMSNGRPEFVLDDADFELETRYFNGIPIPLYRTEGNASQIKGWVENPRVDMILNRWRNDRYMSVDASPDDEEMLQLMLDYDDGSFTIQDLGEDVKRNGVREPIIVTWDGTLIDGNRRKFAVKWALSSKGGASPEQHHRLARTPMFVLPEGASNDEKQSIIIQENYAESLKREWPQVVTNGRIYRRYEELARQFPHEQELAIRQRVRREFPRFSTTEIRNRISTWNLIEEFRADYGDEDNEDDLETRINKSFQYFRQANDTYRNKNVFSEPEFKELLFNGIQKELFPSFASVRRLEEIYRNPRATEIFSEGEGLSGTGLRSNFDRATAVANHEEATRNLTLERRLESIIDSIDELTSVQLAQIPPSLRSRLESTLQRIIAQSSVSADESIEANAVE